jgi:uncharacterized protein
VSRGAAQLVDAATGALLVSQLELATTFWQRFRGWQFRSLPPPGAGLLLAPCSAIHTCWMRFAIDVAWLDARGRVLALKPHVAPWRFTLPVREGRFVVEVPAGRVPWEVGQRLAVIGAAGDELLAALHASESAD